jgi:uncharacterized protein YqcC (DUF446 family)
MQVNGKIAIYNRTRNELEEVDCMLQVENYWRQLDSDERVYLLEEYAFVDASWLDMLAHEHFIEDGWTVLQ